MAAPMAVTAVQAAAGQYTALAADGTAVRLWPLRSDERDLVAAFFAGCRPSRGAVASSRPCPPAPAAAASGADVDGQRHVAVVAEAGDQTAGMAHFVALSGEPGTAEVAVMVADRFQDRGIGGLQHWLVEEGSRS
jgi:hypothetical protein